MDMNQLLRALGLQQAYQAYQQNIGEPFAAVVGGAGRGYLGLDKPEYGGLLSEEAYKTGQAMGNMPAVGVPAGAFKAAAQAPGLLSDAAHFLRNLSPEQMGLLGITAFHGSPHKFSKFDASKIGTGEGAQMYGHGLYFAESPDVAKTYSPRSPKYEENLLNMYKKAESSGNYPMMEVLEDAMTHSTPSDILKKFTNVDDGYTAQHKKAAEQFVKWYQKNKPEVGGFYTVDIPDEMIGKMLDWDKPLGQQKELKDVLNKIKNEIALPKLQDAEGAGFAYQALANAVGGQANASALLRQYGIPGISYLDQGSRGLGQGTRNFVVFPGEEEAIKMLSVD